MWLSPKITEKRAVPTTSGVLSEPLFSCRRRRPSVDGAQRGGRGEEEEWRVALLSSDWQEVVTLHLERRRRIRRVPPVSPPPQLHITQRRARSRSLTAKTLILSDKNVNPWQRFL